MPRKKATKTNTAPSSSTTQQSPMFSNNVSYLLIILLMVASFAAGYLFLKLQSQNAMTAGAGTGTTQQVEQQPAAPTTVDVAKVKALFKDGFMHFGDANKKVLFVEVSDPSCPYCHVAGGKDPELAAQMSPQFKYESEGGTYQPPVEAMRKLVEEGKASYVQIYAPGHGNGELATQAMYCANDKGNYWEVHDLLMSKAGYDLVNDEIKNDKANIPALVQFLSSATDANYLQTCLENGTHADKIARDTQLAQTIGYQGTPHFIINDKIFGGAQSFTAMQDTVNQLLK